MRTLYAVPWYTCNLNCPHCHVSHRDIPVNYGKFINELRAVDGYDYVVLFGGEPTLEWNKCKEILLTGKINSMSTNLTVFPSTFIKSEFIDVLRAANVNNIATSWNLKRFTPALADIWYENLALLCKLGVDVLVMITLTRDLV